MPPESSDEWTFECKECDETRSADCEAGALIEAKNHLEYGRGGHFNYRIISPEGEVTHG